MRRPEVNLDKIAAALDRAIEHPATKVAEQYFPDTVARLHQIRDNLPEVASGLERKAVAGLEVEAKRLARELERELLGGLGAFLDETLGRAPPKRKRLRAKKRRRR
jgi:hypothetical protein